MGKKKGSFHVVLRSSGDVVDATFPQSDDFEEQKSWYDQLKLPPRVQKKGEDDTMSMISRIPTSTKSRMRSNAK